jgi:hypothetical protein
MAIQIAAKPHDPAIADFKIGFISKGLNKEILSRFSGTMPLSALPTLEPTKATPKT